MSIALLLGGSSQRGMWADAILQICSLVVLVVAMASLTTPQRLLVPLAVLAAALAIPLVQVAPLPPSVWPSLPGRGIAVEIYEVAAIPLPWLPMSLDPAATWQSMLSLLPGAAVFLAVAQLEEKSRRSLTLLLVAIGMLATLFGLAQLMQGPSSPLRLFAITNQGDSVGFFANRNHHAALLVVVIPLVVAWMIGLLHDSRPERWLALLSGAIALAVLILGLALARSRAGILLGGVACIGSLLIAARFGGRLSKIALLVVSLTTAAGVLLAVHFAFFAVSGRFEDGLGDDYRWTIAQVTLIAANAFQPLGSGFGTFVAVYQQFEPVHAILPTYINHAHNDYLEILLEGGWPAAAIVILFVLWFSVVGARAWLTTPDKRGGLDRSLKCAASISVLTLLLHSFVDYPLRTAALAVSFAFFCALLVDPVPRATPIGRSRPKRSLVQILSDRRQGARRASWTSARGR